MGRRWAQALGLFVLLLAAAGCASTGAAPEGLSGGIAGLIRPEPDQRYEAASVRNAADVLPDHVVSGPHHSVAPEVALAGPFHVYQLRTESGGIQVTSDALLAERIGELEGLALLDSRRGGAAYLRGAQQTALFPIVVLRDLVVTPGRTLAAVPKGLGRYLARLAEMPRVPRGHLEESATKELIQLSPVKRQTAAAAGVDVYSPNPVVQRRLNRLAWAMYAGGVTASAAAGMLDSPYSTAISGVRTAGQFGRLLGDTAPEDLRRANRAALLAQNVPRDTANALLANPWYAPWRETSVVDALHSLEGVKGRDVFAALAATAQSEAEAALYERSAKMLEWYHAEAQPLETLLDLAGFPAAEDANGGIHVFLAWDHALWSAGLDRMAGIAGAASAGAQNAAQTTRAEAAGRNASSPGAGLNVYATGTVSERARNELEARGWRVHAQAFPQLSPFTLPEE